MPKKFTEAQIDEIVKTYKKVNNIRKTAEILNIGECAVFRYLKKRNESYGKDMSIVLRYSPNIELSSFSVPDNKSTYFYGLLITDGNLSNNSRIEIALQASDAHILEELKNYIKSDNKIKVTERKKGWKPRARFSFACTPIVNNLKALGLEPRKSCKEKLPPLEWQTKDFWRGVLDGDGYICNKNSESCSTGVVGSKELCEGFLNFLELNITFVTKRQVKERKDGSQNNKLYSVVATGADAAKILRLIYSDSTVHLNRKKELADFWIDKYTKAGKI